MNAFFDSIARAFETIGLHPVLGAFIAGAVIAYVFARRSSRDAAAPGSHGLKTHSTAPSVAFKSVVSNAEDISLTVNGRNINLPREVMNLYAPAARSKRSRCCASRPARISKPRKISSISSLRHR